MRTPCSSFIFSYIHVLSADTKPRPGTCGALAQCSVGTAELLLFFSTNIWWVPRMPDVVGAKSRRHSRSGRTFDSWGPVRWAGTPVRGLP